MIDKEYIVRGPDGQASLPDLFEGRGQLLIYHFMFDPDWDEAATGRSRHHVAGGTLLVRGHRARAPVKSRVPAAACCGSVPVHARRRRPCLTIVVR
ncbi:MAG TPA: DUF899 family protein [Trebonia sp.]